MGTYLLHGVRIRSSVALVSAQRTTAARRADPNDQDGLETSGEQPDLLVEQQPCHDDAILRTEPPTGEQWLRFEPTGEGRVLVRMPTGHWLLRFFGIADFCFNPELTRCRVSKAASIDDAWVELLMAGNVISTWLNLKGQCVVHASCLRWQGQTLAFLGPSHAGKSSVAAALSALGAELISDDTLRLSLDADKIYAFPGSTTLRLRQRADHLPGMHFTDLGRSVDERQLILPRTCTTPQSVGHLILLNPSTDIDPGNMQKERLELLPLERAAAMPSLHASMRVLGWTSGEQLRLQFFQALALGQQLPLWRLRFVPQSLYTEAGARALGSTLSAALAARSVS